VFGRLAYSKENVAKFLADNMVSQYKIRGLQSDDNVDHGLLECDTKQPDRCLKQCEGMYQLRIHGKSKEIVTTY
jgi:hypothetical protein